MAKANSHQRRRLARTTKGGEANNCGSPARVLSNSTPGAWMPLGHAAPPPKLTGIAAKFGPPRFTADQQAANPGLPMTRLVKDVLRVGRWKVGMDAANQPQMWDVSPSTLAEIASNFAMTSARGIAMNLTKSHGDIRTGLVPTDDLVSPLDAAIVDGQTLWVSTYVTPEQARFLTNPAVKVSPLVWPGWVDGQGNRYAGNTLLHVAATDQPVVSGQGPFVALANPQSTGANAMDLAVTRDLVNQILSAVGGPQIPEDVDEAGFMVALQMAASMVGGGEAEEPEEPAESETPVVDEGSDLEIPAGMNNKAGRQPGRIPNAAARMPAWARELSASVKALSNQVQSATIGNAKKIYDSKLAELATRGVITPAQRSHLEKTGSAVGYALTSLAVFDLGTASAPVPLSGGKAAKALANAAAPTVGTGGKSAMTAAEHAADLAKRGLKPVQFQ